MDYRGKAIKLGRKGYHLLLATANIGNGEFQGTFESDKALYNRLHVALDLDHQDFKPTEEDEYALDKRKADPNVKESSTRDLTDRLIEASREVDKIASEPGLEALATLSYLRFGLRNCQRNKVKDKVWPMECQDCTYNQDGNAVCSFIRDPVRRTTEAVRRYAASLQYLAKLKDPNAQVDATDLIFKSFELTGAYQSLLNPQILRTTYKGNTPKFMAEVMKKLKEDYAQNQDFIMASLNEAQRGRRVTIFFEDKKKNQIGAHEDLPKKLRTAYPQIEPYSDVRPIGMKWVEGFVDFEAKNAQPAQDTQETKSGEK
jgi:hypothetical protein